MSRNARVGVGARAGGIAAALVAGMVALPASVDAQTEGIVDVEATTLTAGGNFSPRHVLAIWVTDDSGQFVKTLLRRADRRRQYLYTWNDQTGGDSVDAVTGATLSNHSNPVRATWDCRDRSGNVIPDGDYRIRIEFTEEHSQGPLTPVTLLRFTKGPEPVTLTPSNQTYFRNMTLTYGPDTDTEIVVAAESTWKYDDSGTDLHAAGWSDLDFDDSGWSAGPGKLGYSDDAVTVLGDDPKHPCYYFRHEFEIGYIPDSMTARVLRDDGVVVYLNGTEILRDNMDAGATAFDDLASGTTGGDDEDLYFRFQIDPAAVVPGRNILAAEVHQASLTSSDLGFDLELKASPRADVPQFLRGDANGDESVNVSDALAILNYLFVDGDTPGCLSAADTNDDDAINVSDGVSVLLFLFAGGHDMPPPHPDCGEDPTPDGLTCMLPGDCG